MAGRIENGGAGRDGRWRIGAWLVLAGLMLAPWIGMQVSDEVQWTGFDFAVFAAILLVPYAALEIVLRVSGDIFYRAGAVVGLIGAFLLVWANLAVGVIGSENNPVNLLFVGVIVVGAVGALIARFRPWGMVVSVLAAVALYAAICIGVAMTGQFVPPIACLILASPWLLSAALFAVSARRQAAG